MRTKMQQLYDRIYYGLEIKYQNLYRNARCRKTVRGRHYDREFYRQFRQSVVPYWKKYGIRAKPCWYKLFYTLTGEVDPRYIPDDIHHRYIIPHFDDVRCIRVMEDKNLHSLLFASVKRPETVFKHCSGGFWDDGFAPLTRQEAYDRCTRDGRYIIKPTRDTGEGLDIQFFSASDGQEANEAILRSYDGIDYIVQKTIVQHPDLAKLNPTSVNTFRIVTMVRDGQASIIGSILRIGGEKSLVDNISRGGYQAIILPDGTLDRLAFTHRDGKLAHVPQTAAGVVFDGYRLPCWEKLCNTVRDLALRLPHLKLIGWDLTVDDSGDVVLIEFNCDFGQNQENCGPTFGDRTEEILDEVFQTGKGRLLP